MKQVTRQSFDSGESLIEQAIERAEKQLKFIAQYVADRLFQDSFRDPHDPEDVYNLMLKALDEFNKKEGM